MGWLVGTNVYRRLKPTVIKAIPRRSVLVLSCI